MAHQRQGEPGQAIDSQGLGRQQGSKGDMCQQVLLRCAGLHGFVSSGVCEGGGRPLG